MSAHPKTSRRRPSLRALVLGAWIGVAAAVATPSIATACVDGAPKGEAVMVQRDVGTTAAGEHAEFHVLGAGWFGAAEVVKQGGTSDDTVVTVELDGAELITGSFASLKNPWMQINTPFLVVNVRSEGDARTMTIWFSPELKFRAILAVRVEVREEGVAGLRLRAVMNKPGPHEDPVGQTALVLPAFK
ncbi:MAG TPA: hypothetical protein VD791_09215 [Burkholderiales bacterium]|nr:hypothetical protein [Burkholderiales bacterium]